MKSHKLSYRADIDGLRAIAILIVILYHAEIILFGQDWFVGGYIGVDIFFVISGYLITRIILSEVQKTGKFSFLNFYERRARRLLPMLFAIIFVFTPIAWHILRPSDFVEYSESILASLYFGSNFFFYFNTTEYGADSALLKPFLHTWSLSVEEQFYLVFPILSLVIYKYFRSKFLVILIGFSFISLLFSIYLEGRNPDLNFYSPFSRFWELAVGAVLAHRELNVTYSSGAENNRILPKIGLLLVICSIFLFDESTAHPALLTILPVAGVALIIGFPSQNEIVGRLLGIKAFVSVGLISYSAYLWHFPIFALARHTSLTHTNYDKLLWIVLTIVLSIASYFIVEKPFRRRNFINGKKLFFSLVSSTLITISGCLLVSKGHITKSQDVSIEYLLDKNAFRAEAHKFEFGFDYSVKTNNKKNVLIVGNSHAEDLLKALSFSYLNEEFNLNLVSPKKRTKDINYQIRCFLAFLEKEDTTCTQNSVQGTVEYGPNIKHQFSTADYIILASRWNDKMDVAALPLLIETLLSHGKKIVVVSNTPESKIFGERKLNRFDRFIFESKQLPSVPQLKQMEAEFYLDYLERQSTINENISSMVDKISDPRVVFAYRSDYMCDFEKQRCYLYLPNNNAKVLRDYGHITTDGARKLGQIINERNWLADFMLENPRDRR